MSRGKKCVELAKKMCLSVNRLTEVEEVGCSDQDPKSVHSKESSRSKSLPEPSKCFASEISEVLPDISTREKVFSYLQNIQESPNCFDPYEFREQITDDSNLFRVQASKNCKSSCYIPYLEVMNTSSEINSEKFTCEIIPECSQLDNNKRMFPQNKETEKIQNITSEPINLRSQNNDNADDNKKLIECDILSKYTTLDTEYEKSKPTNTDLKEKIRILEHITITAPFTYKPVYNVDDMPANRHKKDGSPNFQFSDESSDQMSDDTRDADYNLFSDDLDSSLSSSSRGSTEENILYHVKERKDICKAECHSSEIPSVIIHHEDYKQTSDDSSFSISCHGKKQKSASTIRIFNQNEYYTLHGDDANLAADFTSNLISYMGETPKLSYVCINQHQLETLLRELLLVRQYRVEIYIKVPGSSNQWQLEYSGSPGNITQFQQILFENVDMHLCNSVMAIKLCKKNTVAVSNINTIDLKFEVGEFTDNECLTEIEALIAQISPKEVIISSGDSPELNILKSTLERNGVLVTQVKRSDFNSEDVIQDLNRLLFFQKDQKRNAESFPETNLKEAMGCLGAVIKFLKLTADSEENLNQYRIGELDVQRYVRLDNAALYALNILPKPTTNNVGALMLNNVATSHNLLSTLNSCVTSQGKRLLEQWIKEPLKDYKLINERLDIVECFVRDSEIRTLVSKNTLAKMPDLIMLSKKILGKKAKLQDCYRLYQAINLLLPLINVLQKIKNNCIGVIFVNPLKEFIADMDRYQAMIETMLDLDLVDRYEFLIKNSVNSELNELHMSKQNIEEEMQKLLRKAARDLNLEEQSIKLECNPQHGYYFRVTKKEEQVLRQAKNYQILDTVAGGVRFKNENLMVLNKEYLDINEKYEESQKVMVAEILKVAGSYADTVRGINMVIAALDVLISFANSAVSAKVPYVRPILKPSEERIIKLNKIRHPCLEQQDHVNFIPNDIHFDKDDGLFYIITGPNMCGKSTYIRSVGICVHMAHIGSWVPCDYAEISLVDAILARVGADDCQLKGLSTFTLEMIETSAIVKTATKNSLVIIDELGRGTSTYDGCGIAWAIAEYLAADVNCFSLFATHFHKISKLSDMYPMVKNLHVSAVTSNSEVTPLYQIKKGECDKSYGIHCAKLVDFLPDVLERASKNLFELEYHESMKYVKIDEAVIKKKVVEEGDQCIKHFLNRLKLAIDNSSDADIEKLISAMKEEVIDTMDKCK